MKFKFNRLRQSNRYSDTEKIALLPSAPKKSIVHVFFPARGRGYAYYNDRFDLHVGDLVYVEGKLEGLPGRVTEVNYQFKIKLSDYKRVLYLVDTAVQGTFFTAGDHCITFDRNTLNAKKVSNWFRAPWEDCECVSGGNDSSFALDSLAEMDVSSSIVERGVEYYKENKVRFLCLDGIHGYAIVEGSEPYEVEFDYEDGQIKNLVCPCFCIGHCKHEVAALLQLKETLEIVEELFSEEYAKTGYFAAIYKCLLYAYAIEGKRGRSFVL